MGKMKELAILIAEFAKQRPDDFDYLETLSEEAFRKDPCAIQLASDLGVSVDFLADGFMHDVE